MNDEELLRFFRNPAKGICGRLSSSQLDRALVMAGTPAKGSRWWRYLLVPSLLGAAPAFSQPATPATTQLPAQRQHAVTRALVQMTISGTVRDSLSLEPLGGAVVVVDCGPVHTGTTCDEEGNYSIRLSCAAGDSVVLVAHFVGAGSVTKTVFAAASATVDFVLAGSIAEEPVVIAGDRVSDIVDFPTPVLTGDIRLDITPSQSTVPVKGFRRFFYRMFHPRKKEITPQ